MCIKVFVAIVGLKEKGTVSMVGVVGMNQTLFLLFVVRKKCRMEDARVEKKDTLNLWSFIG